jgi:hypothetical protein
MLSVPPPGATLIDAVPGRPVSEIPTPPLPLWSGSPTFGGATVSVVDMNRNHRPCAW